MTKQQATRKKRFNAALRLVGMNQKEWAESRGRTLAHLSPVLNGRRESAILVNEIDAFIEKTFAKHMAPKDGAAA